MTIGMSNLFLRASLVLLLCMNDYFSLSCMRNIKQMIKFPTFQFVFSNKLHSSKFTSNSFIFAARNDKKRKFSSKLVENRNPTRRQTLFTYILQF